MRLDQHQPRQLGSLHDRMAYVMSLVCGDLELEASHSDLWHALFDLEGLVGSLPDVAYHKVTDKIVPADHREAKRGVEKPSRHIVQLQRRFDHAWNRLADEGKCDGFGGAEYRRVLASWIKANDSSQNLNDFIVAHANRDPRS